MEYSDTSLTSRWRSLSRTRPKGRAWSDGDTMVWRGHWPGAEAIAFFQARLATWAANAVAIGSTPEEIGAFSTLVSAAATARDAQIDAINLKKASTQTYHTSTDEMRTAGVALIGRMKNFAKYTQDPQVYALAQIPEPQPGEPTPPPGVPFNPDVTLRQGGRIIVAFRSVNPGSVGGVTYEVYRQLDGQGEFAYLLTSGERAFEDQALPSGTAMANYMVRGRRSTTIGPFAEFVVRFGTGNQVSVSASFGDKTAS